MEIVFALLGAVLVAAIVLTVIERRRGKPFTATDDTQTPQTHADREEMRITAEITDRQTGHRDPH